MDLIKTILKLQFAEAFRPWLEMRNLMRVVAENPSLELQGPPVVLDNERKRIRQVFQFRAYILEQEGKDPLDTVTRGLDLITKANEASPFPAIDQARYESIFIEPYALPFHELVMLLKDRYLRPNPMVDSSTDIGLTFDQHDGEVVKHIQLGPMQVGQLRAMFLVWPRDEVPDQFVFISAGYERNRQTVFDPSFMRGFLEEAIQWQKEQVRTILDYLFDKGG